MAYANFINNDYESHNEFVTNNVDLVKRIALHLAARLPANVEINDLMQAGMIGLLEAAGSFDASKGASFDTFAGIRIRGAMLDELRKLDWAPRSVHKKYRKVAEAIREIESESGRPAQGAEVAARLGMSANEYHDILADAAHCQLFSLDETLDDPMHQRELPASDTAEPDRHTMETQFKEQLAASIRRLPEREQLVLSLYYEKELNLKEIGAVLEVSESRVCQIHGQALIRLRSMTHA